MTHPENPRVAPVLVLVAGPEDIDAVHEEFRARYARDYDLRRATSGDEAEALARELVAGSRRAATRRTRTSAGS